MRRCSSARRSQGRPNYNTTAFEQAFYLSVSVGKDAKQRALAAPAVATSQEEG